jgi:hypothetical protein
MAHHDLTTTKNNELTWALSLRPRSDQCRDVTRHESSFNLGGLEIASWEFIDSTLQRWDPRLVHVVRFVRRLASCRRRPPKEPTTRKEIRESGGRLDLRPELLRGQVDKQTPDRSYAPKCPPAFLVVDTHRRRRRPVSSKARVIDRDR